MLLYTSSKYGVSLRDPTTHNQRVRGTILKSRILELDRTRLCAARGLFDLGRFVIGRDFSYQQKQASSYNKNEKNNQVHLKQANDQSSNNKITITQHHTHSFQPQCPKDYCWWFLPCGSLLPVSHGIAAARALHLILVNEAAVPGARLTPHKQRMDRAIERLGRRKLNCSLNQESLAHALLPCFQIDHQEPAILIYPLHA